MTALVIDDHPLVAEGCRTLLADIGIENVEIALTLSEGFRLYRKTKPDLIILDLSMQARSLAGLNFIRRFRIGDQRTPIIAFSMYDEDGIARRALGLGANAYVLKDASAAEFVEAVVRVREGGRYLSHDMATRLAFHSPASSNPLHGLTLRELQTLSLISEGNKYEAIAEELNISYKTVVNVVASLKTKLKAQTLPELIRIGINALPMSRSQPARD